jgi:hypothetical protein
MHLNDFRMILFDLILNLLVDTGRLWKNRHHAKLYTWILHESEAFIGKASKDDVVVLYFDPLATQHMEASDSPDG